jgi:hypothetical protein
MLARCTEDAQTMSRAVRWGDAAYIEDMAERGGKIRRSLIALKQAWRSRESQRRGQPSSGPVLQPRRIRATGSGRPGGHRRGLRV